MSIKILPYADEHMDEVKAFNTRLNANAGGFNFPEIATSSELPPNLGHPIEQKYYIARDLETKKIHGGYILKSFPIFKMGQEEKAGNYQLPLSEGIINPQYGMIGIQLYLDAIKKESKLYSLGMGNIERPLPQFLKKMGWRVEGVPFYFKILNPGKVIKNLPAIKNHPKIKPFLFFLDHLKVFALGIYLLNFLNKCKVFHIKEVECIIESEFGEWANDLWNNAKNNYAWIATRNAACLNLLYPKNSPRFIRLHIKRAGQTIGWALVLATQMGEHKQFPFLKLGTIADTLALPGEELTIMKMAADFLTKQNLCQ